MNKTAVDEVLADIEQALAAVTWKRVEAPKDREAEFFQGAANGWDFNICSFDIEDQGFGPGARGYDGAGCKESLVVRLTRELAEKAVKLAKEQLP